MSWKICQLLKKQKVTKLFDKVDVSKVTNDNENAQKWLHENAHISANFKIWGNVWKSRWLGKMINTYLEIRMNNREVWYTSKK